jgi:two-component system, cell cycle sensor histidine kinase and response regulator CckA
MTGEPAASRQDEPGISAHPGRLDGPSPLVANALQRGAERRVRREGDRFAGVSLPLPLEKVREVIRELRVHQGELETQNEELLRAHTVLERSTARYFDLYDRAPVAYVTVGARGRILEANLRAARLLGVDTHALFHAPFARFLSDDSVDTWHLERLALLESSAPRSFELTLKSGNGNLVSCLVEATLAVGTDGQPVARAAVIDLSARQEAEDDRRSLEHGAHQEERAQSLARMAGATAHRFNNLLAVTIGNLELLQADLAPEPAVLAPLSDALRAARSAGELSGMLLASLGLDRGPCTRLDVGELWRRELPSLRRSMPPGVVVEDDFQVPLPLVEASPTQLVRVLTLLVDNAREAMAAREGWIRIAVHTVAGDVIPGRHRAPGHWIPRPVGHIRLTVTDQGAGMDPSHVHQVFDPFFSTKGLGRGLGLAVALGAVRAHGGGMSIRREEAGGTTVQAYIPVPTEGLEGATASGDATKGVPAAGASKGPPSRMRPPIPGAVLVVEDEPLVRSVAARALKRIGFEVIEASDGVEALQRFREHRARIRWVFCDVVMPRMDGWETLDALRAMDPGLPVVLTSGFDEGRGLSRPNGNVAQAFVPKPWTLTELEEVAHSVADSPRPGSRPRGGPNGRLHDGERAG